MRNRRPARLRRAAWRGRGLADCHGCARSQINAVLHGNAYDPGKNVNSLEQQRSSDLIITIRDEGKGLDPEEVPDPLAPENLLKIGARHFFNPGVHGRSSVQPEPGTEITLSSGSTDQPDGQEAST